MEQNPTDNAIAGSRTDLIAHPYLSGIDPLFHTHVHILARMLDFMEPLEGDGHADPPLYFFRFPPSCQPRPVRLVALAGIVIYLAVRQKVSKPVCLCK